MVNDYLDLPRFLVKFVVLLELKKTFRMMKNWSTWRWQDTLWSGFLQALKLSFIFNFQILRPKNGLFLFSLARWQENHCGFFKDGFCKIMSLIFFQNLRQYQGDSNSYAERHREHRDYFAELFRAAQGHKEFPLSADPFPPRSCTLLVC